MEIKSGTFNDSEKASVDYCYPLDAIAADSQLGTPEIDARSSQPPLAGKRSDTERINSCNDSQQWSDDELFAEVYPRLCQIAHRQLRKGWWRETIQTEELVAELYFRLLRTRLPQLKNQSHFYGICARLVQQMLIERLRKMKSLKRGGEYRFVSVHESIELLDNVLDEVLRLNRAMRKLRRFDPWLSLLAGMHLYLEMTFSEMAEALGVTEPKIKADYKFARAWLQLELS